MVADQLGIDIANVPVADVRRFVHIGTEAALFYGQHMRNVDEHEPLPAQIEAAVAVQDRFERDPKNIKDQTLAARADMAARSAGWPSG